MEQFTDFDINDIKKERKMALEGQNVSKIFITGFLLVVAISIPLMVMDFIIQVLASKGQLLLSAIIATLVNLLYAFVASFTFTNLILKYSRGQEVRFSLLMETFENALQRIGMTFLKGLFVFLWSLIAIAPIILYIAYVAFKFYGGYYVDGYIDVNFFVFLLMFPLMIPAMTRTYAYMFSEFIMLDDAMVTPMEAIKNSVFLTKGYKWKLFVVTLKLLGAVLLAGIILIALLAFMAENIGVLALVMFIPFAIVITYFYIICFLDISIYYNFLSGYYKKRDGSEDIIDSTINEAVTEIYIHDDNNLS